MERYEIKLKRIFDEFSTFHKHLEGLINGYNDYLRLHAHYLKHIQKYGYRPQSFNSELPGQLIASARTQMIFLLSRDIRFARSQAWLESLIPEKITLFRLVNNEVFKQIVLEHYNRLQRIPNLGPGGDANARNVQVKEKKTVFATYFVKAFLNPGSDYNPVTPIIASGSQIPPSLDTFKPGLNMFSLQIQKLKARYGDINIPIIQEGLREGIASDTLGARRLNY